MTSDVIPPMEFKYFLENSTEKVNMPGVLPI